MAIQNFIPTIWSAKILDNLDKVHVSPRIVNRDHEGEITGFGDTVKINQVGDVQVNPYVKGVTVINPQELDSNQTTLLIDQAEYFAFQIQDIDKAQQNPKIMSKAMERAAYALADKADQFILGMHAQAGNTIGTTAIPVDINGKNIIEILAQVGQKLTEANVSTLDRFIVVPPAFHTKMVLAKIISDFNNSDTITNGFVGKALGFNFHVSNNVVNTAGAKYKIVAGSTQAISFAEQIVSVEAYRPQNSFSDAVKGLHVYGGKVVQPNALVTLTANIVAEV